MDIILNIYSSDPANYFILDSLHTLPLFIEALPYKDTVVQVCMHVYVCVYMYACMSLYVCMYVCIYACTCVCMYICLCVHVCVCVCVHTRAVMCVRVKTKVEN